MYAVRNATRRLLSTVFNSIESLQFYRMYVTIRYGIHRLPLFDGIVLCTSFKSNRISC